MLNISNRFFKFKHISIIFILFTIIFFVLVYYFISSSKEEIISKDIKINPQELYLQNSNKIFFINNKSSPIISITLIFKGGSGLDPINKEGLAKILSSMLLQGSNKQSAEDFQKVLDEYSIRISTDSTRDSIIIHISFLNYYKEKAFSVLKYILNNKDYNTKEFEIIKQQMQTNLNFLIQDSSYIASNLLIKSIFPNNIYFRDVNGTKESIDNITIQDLIQYKDTFINNNVSIGVSGNIDNKDLLLSLNTALEDVLKMKVEFNHKKSSPVISNKVLKVLDSKYKQSDFMIAMKSPQRNDPDYLPFIVLDSIFGGGSSLNSILMEKIRIEQGLVYSISSNFVDTLYGSFWVVSGSTSNVSIGDSMKAFKNIIYLLQDNTYDISKIEDTKTWLRNSYIMRFANNSISSSTLAYLLHYGYNIDYIYNRSKNIKSITKDDIERVIKKYLTGNFYTVIVGDEANK